MSSQETAQGADPGDVRAQWRSVHDAEQTLLTSRAAARVAGSAAATGRYSTGLCLSGGGIRSASVSLGLLQALAEKRMIQHIDYLSSVSGGGYTAATLALRYAQASKAGRTDPDAAFPLGEESDALARLRHAANYLAPTGFGSYTTGFFVVARSLVLNVFIWLFLGGLAFALLMALFYEGQERCMLLPWRGQGACGWAAFFDWLLVAAATLAALLVALVAGFSLSGWRLMTNPAGSDGDGAAGEIATPVRVAVAAVALAAVAAILLPHGLDGIVDGTLGSGGTAAATALVLVALMALTPLLGPRIPPTLLAALVVSAIVVIAVTAWMTDRVPGLLGDSRSKVAILVALGLALWLRLQAGRATPAADISAKYARRRVQERVSARLLLGLVLCLVLATVPIAPLLAHWLSETLKGETAVLDIHAPEAPRFSLTVVYLVSGAAALIGYYRTRLQGVLGTGTATLLVIGAVLLFYGTAVLAYAVAIELVTAATPGVALAMPQVLAVAGLTAALLLAFLVNINDLSLGRYYRDRLIEAFMPDARTAVDDLDQPATAADRFRLTEIAGFVEPEPAAAAPATMLEQVVGAPAAAVEAPPLLGPYPLVNTYVVRRRSPDAVARRRGGDGFLISPLYCGASETGYKRTAEVIKGELTLATAMAISGAAANPGGGLAGRGVTTNLAVVAAMAFLSLRLGYRFRWDWDSPIRQFLNPFGNHVIPAFTEIAAEFAGRPSHRNVFVDLSDGGHFENLGIYELVRRRCGLIIVCDGGQDPTASYEAFVSALTLIREDFDTRVAFDMRVRGSDGLAASGPQQVVARTVEDEYPRGADFSERGYFLATLHYPPEGTETRVQMAEEGPTTGQVIYLKSAMIRSLSLAARGYKGANAAFPYEPTSDQFFSPEQFAAYLEVGREIGRQMLRETALPALFAGGRPPLERLRWSGRFSPRCL